MKGQQHKDLFSHGMDFTASIEDPFLYNCICLPVQMLRVKRWLKIVCSKMTRDILEMLVPLPKLISVSFLLVCSLENISSFILIPELFRLIA